MRAAKSEVNGLQVAPHLVRGHRPVHGVAQHFANLHAGVVGTEIKAAEEQGGVADGGAAGAAAEGDGGVDWR